jgi:hypothetical protein
MQKAVSLMAATLRMQTTFMHKQELQWLREFYIREKDVIEASFHSNEGGFYDRDSRLQVLKSRM